MTIYDSVKEGDGERSPKKGKGGKKRMKTQIEDIRNNADITPNWNDIRNIADNGVK